MYLLLGDAFVDRIDVLKVLDLGNFERLAGCCELFANSRLVGNKLVQTLNHLVSTSRIHLLVVVPEQLHLQLF